MSSNWIEAEAVVSCPSCKSDVVVGGEATWCSCGWTGRVWAFDPVPITVARALSADASDATCAHHPTKQASAVCAGSGDYICSLCAVPLEGETYSAQYLASGGKGLAQKAFERFLPRPDRVLSGLYLVTLFLYFFAAVIFPIAVANFIKVVRLRAADPVFRRLVGRGSVGMHAVLTLVLGAVAVGSVLMIVEIFQ